MAATKENPIVFYDILATDGHWSPSTYKTRLTLNYKRLPYRVEFVSIADIATKLKGLGVPPTPNFRTGYSLPVIADPSSDPNGKPTYVAESFDIAAYLDDKYPAPHYPLVFPPGTRPLQKIASTLFAYEVSMSILPIVVPFIATPGFLDERGTEYFRRTREEWMGSLSDLSKAAPEKWIEARKKWDDFGAKLDLNKRTDEEGPFVMGDQISFSDFAVGGAIVWLRRAEGGEMARWKEMAEWQGGRWAKLWAEIGKLEKDSTEVV
ncbi:hypothetical protein BDV93DRAFT_522358 [Ceratobasidium sp. AG-I]|nr:hypothetical protein BDV93DRAFT_522358 [Ceratobasidium sp. AG-I]